jgi:hypothetical protein
MPSEERDTERHEANLWRRFRLDPSLIATLQWDTDAAAAAGDRLAASADPEAVPLPVVHLSADGDDEDRQ